MDDTLPPPDPVGREHSERLSDLIAEQMVRGPLSFADYMRLALYTPGLGYYMAGAPKFGAEGDFITAPELSPIFGQCIAEQCLEVFNALDARPAILELGAGSGKLAASVLTHLGDQCAADYLILEPGAELRDRQRRWLADSLSPQAFARVRWLDAMPTSFSGVIIANEVMDALPVERFARIDGALWQVAVDIDDNTLHDVLVPAPDDMIEAVEAIEADIGRALPDDYASEYCPHLTPWIRALSDALQSGVVLLADYGYPRSEYYLPERRSGTLACYYRHRTHGDPYLWPGLQDITAHVDFTASAEAGVAAGMDLLGYSTQSAFLLGCDLQNLVERAHASLEHEVDRMTQAREVRTLTLPGEMGERFQFIAFGKGYDRALRGFALQDLTHRL